MDGVPYKTAKSMQEQGKPQGRDKARWKCGDFGRQCGKQLYLMPSIVVSHVENGRLSCRKLRETADTSPKLVVTRPALGVNQLPLLPNTLQFNRLSPGQQPAVPRAQHAATTGVGHADYPLVIPPIPPPKIRRKPMLTFSVSLQGGPSRQRCRRCRLRRRRHCSCCRRR